MKRTATVDDYIWLGVAPPEPPAHRVLGPVWSAVRGVLITMFVVVVPLLICALSVALGYLWLEWYVHR